MELRCFICKREVDVGDELTFFFECHVYCGECLQQMERNERTSPSRPSRQEFLIQNVQ